MQRKGPGMKKILIGSIIFIICFLILTHGALRAQSAVNEGDVMAKLKDIASSQKEILDALNSIKEEVQIIKIRITQNQ